MIWPYSNPVLSKAEIVMNAYVSGQVGQAQTFGFEFLGRSHDLKGASYKVDYFFLTSRDRETLAIIGVGKVVKIPVQGTWLFTIGPDDTAFYSVNHQSCVEFDPLGKWKSQLVFDASFNRLYDAHKSWLQKLNVPTAPFRKSREIDDFRQARDSRIEFLIRKGLVKRVTANPEYWKYTLLGAFRCGAIGYFVGLYRALKAGRT